MPSKVPDHQKDANSSKSTGDTNSRPDSTTSGLVTAHPVDHTTLQSQFLRGQDIQTIMTSQANLFQQMLTSFSDSQARTTQQILTSFSHVAAKTTTIENKVLSSISDTTNKIQSLENQLSTLSNDTSKLAPDTKLTALEKNLTDLKSVVATDTKVSSLEQDIADLRIALPSRKVLNIPIITDVSSIQIPLKSGFELASKTVKLKDLVNSLSAISFPSDEIKDVKHTYSQIRQAVDIGCSTSSLLPEIEHEHSVPNFFEVLVPKATHQFYSSILSSYKAISNALLNFFIRKETVSSSATRVTNAISTVKHSTDGFVFLATVLHKLLPQFGGEPLNLLDEMKSLSVVNGEDLEDF